jgi:DNA-binding NarL/FixJ family response regulator
MALRVLVAEDCPVMQRSIRELLERADIRTLVETCDGQEAVRLAVEMQPDVAILDYSMPGMNGIDASRAILLECPQMPIILLTTAAAEYLIAAALNAGIRGYVLKGDAGDNLVRAIHAVRRGATYLSPRAARALRNGYPQPQEQTRERFPQRCSVADS